MITDTRGGGRLPLQAFALVLGISVISSASAMADDGGPVVEGQVRKGHKGIKGHHVHGPTGVGTLGYGPPGLYPGFQGFGLGYHLGYGYGGDALGVGAEGGYPFYGGPGYPHCEPRLRRLGGIVPFPYYGGPGYPTPEHPNYFGGMGPLVPDQPVVSIVTDRDEPIEATNYGIFTGAIPNPEALFAPFTARAAAGVSSMRARSAYPTGVPTPPPLPADSGSGRPRPSTPPAPGETSHSPATGPSLGIEAEPIIDAGGVRGVRVSKVYPGTVAEKSGIHAGDVIHSINDRLTSEPGNLVWIIANAAPDKVLKMSVRPASDGKVQTITARIP
jgi:hypothetical protein